MSKRQSVVALSTTKYEYMTTHSCKKGSRMVTKILFGYWVGTTNCKDRLCELEWNLPREELGLSFKDKTY
jgi:hypothetical protein